MSDDGSLGGVTAANAPAVALWEFASIVDGIHGADAITKASPVHRLLSGTVHPGKYVVLVAGDTAAVGVALETIDDMDVEPLDTRFLPDVAAGVIAAFHPEHDGIGDGDAIGVVETTTIAGCIDAADAGLKAAAVDLAGLHLGDDLGGKAYLVVEGSVGDVEAAVDAAADRAGAALVKSIVIPQLTDEVRRGIAASPRFGHRLARPDGEAT